MSNFGFFDLRLVDAYDVAYEEARSAVGASDLLRNAKTFPSLADAVGDCAAVIGTTSGNKRDLSAPLYDLPVAPSILGAGRTAILFGSEKHGLSRDALSNCHWLVRIPSRPEHGSINLGQAVALVLYELVRKEAAPPRRAGHTASQESLQRLEALLREMLAESGYLLIPSTERKLRRMIRNLDLPAKDSEMWQGMLRQVLWRLRDNRIRYDQSSDKP